VSRLTQYQAAQERHSIQGPLLPRQTITQSEKSLVDIVVVIFIFIRNKSMNEKSSRWPASRRWPDLSSGFVIQTLGRDIQDRQLEFASFEDPIVSACAGAVLTETALESVMRPTDGDFSLLASWTSNVTS